MKKYIALFLTLVCVLGLIGCKRIYPKYIEPDFTEHPIVKGNTHADISGVFVQIHGIYTFPDQTTKLTVAWINETDRPIMYGETYWIERLENGQWVDCSIKENVFATTAHELQANKSVYKSYALTNVYDISASGTYRFRSSCSVDVGDGKQTACSLWAEFIIE